jgi:nucleoid-associated protein YgaU
MGASAVAPLTPHHPPGRHLRLVPAPPSRACRRRGRATAAAAALAVSAAVGLGALRGQDRPAAAGPAARPGTVHVVQPGDTLWSVARRLAPDGDVRAVVDRLAAAHGGTALAPGDRIPLPDD